MDYGATHHMTNDVTHIHNSASYAGYEGVVVGNDTSQAIKHLGFSVITINNHVLKLYKVLPTPKISFQSIVCALCADNNVSVEFSANSFFCKEGTNRELISSRQNE